MLQRSCLAVLVLSLLHGVAPSIKLSALQAQAEAQSAGPSSPQLAAGTGPKKPLTLERLYRLPSLIGTRPESPVWSPDSQRLAFLWNDAGMPFLDVWVVDTAAGNRPVRLTRMPHPEAPADPGVDVAKLEAQARFETDHGVGSVAWAADGKRLFFTLHGRLYGWVAGGKPPLLLRPDRVAAMFPAPVGSRLALLTTEGAVEVLDGGTSLSLYTPPAVGVAAEEVHWSPDGAQLAVVEVDGRGEPVRGIPDYLLDETALTPTKRPFPGEPAETRRVGIVSAGSGTMRWLTLPGTPMDLIFSTAWSPDSRSLLVDRSDLYIKHRRLLRVDVATGAIDALVQEDDPRNVTAEWWCGWAPDGKGIYFTSDEPPATDYAVFYKALAGGPQVQVVGGDFAVFGAEIAPGGNALFATVNAGKPEERQVMRVDVGRGRGGPPQMLRWMPGTRTAVASPDGQFVADVFSSDTAPPDLYLQRVAEGVDSAPERVTVSSLPEFDEYRWVAATYVTFRNVHDGTVLHARMTLPPDVGKGGDRSKPHAAILGSVYSNTARNQWGGRIFHPTWGLDQFLAQQGYVLLNADIRGSSGYGRAFRQRLALDYGGVDVDDLYSAAQYLVTSGTADPHRMGMWGSSYGGLLTATSLFTHPETFQAGVAGAPATSLFHALTGEMRTMMDPQTHAEQYRQSSAYLKSGGLEGHLMLLQGMRDDVVLFKDSVVLTERLILQGKDVTLTPLPDAPHGWDTQGLAQTRYAYGKLVDYFNRWVPVK